MGVGNWYSGPSPMPSLGFVPIGIYQCQPSPQACPEPPPFPMGCVRGFGCCTYQPTFQRASPSLHRAASKQHRSTQPHAEQTQADNKSWIFSPFSCTSACAEHSSAELPISLWTTMELESLHCREWGNIKLKSLLGPPVT